MNEKLKVYYSMVDMYDVNNMNNIKYLPFNESDTEEEDFFKHFFPISLDILMRYLKYIIYDICKKYIDKDKVLKEIEKLKKTISIDSKINDTLDYTWNDVSLKELLKGDYNYLKAKFVLKFKDVPDYNSFINNFCYPMTELVYPFSIKELYRMVIERAINVAVNNYYYEKKK